MKFLSCTIFLLQVLFCYPQTYAKLRGLKQATVSSPSDTAAIRSLIHFLALKKAFLRNDTVISYELYVYDHSKKVHYDAGVGISAVNLGNAYTSAGNYSKALTYLVEAEKIYSKANDYKNLASLYNIMGNTYLGTGNLESQKIYFSKCYEIGLNHNLPKYKAYGAAGLGNYYGNLKNYESSNKWMILASDIFKNTANKTAYAICLVNVATNYRWLHNIVKANEYINLAKPAVKAADFNYATYLYYKEVGEIYMERHVYDLAIHNYRSALELMLHDKANHNISDIYKSLADASLKAKLYPQTVEYLNLHMQYKDSVFNEHNNQQLVDVKEKYETEKKDSEINMLSKQNDLANSELSRKKTMIWFSIGFTLLVLVMFSFVIKSNIQKNKTNALLEKQKVIIEEKQKEILDSINYARRIQFSLLTGHKLLEEHLPGHFIFFQPKDVVSGDFYWATPVKDGFMYITADCTGHGVPGAFMSLLNISKLSQVINEKDITRPDEVLNAVRTEIIKALSTEGSNSENRDGMDAVLCKLNLEAMTLEYAAANNALYIIRDKKLIIHKADKMPVGKDHEEERPFTLYKIELQKGDLIYTFTDGFADQFGGPKGKKFKYKQFEELLLSIHHLPMAEQSDRLGQTFNDWKGALEQIDDICVIGIRV